MTRPSPVNVGDDCIVIKSGYNEDGRRVGIPCEDILVSTCTFAHGHGGVVIGSENNSDVACDGNRLAAGIKERNRQW